MQVLSLLSQANMSSFDPFDVSCTVCGVSVYVFDVSLSSVFQPYHTCTFDDVFHTASLLDNSAHSFRNTANGADNFRMFNFNLLYTVGSYVIDQKSLFLRNCDSWQMLFPSFSRHICLAFVSWPVSYLSY